MTITKTTIRTDTAPQAIGTYSQAVCVGNLLFISGQIGLHPTTGEMVSDDFVEQTEQVLANLKAVCEAGGGKLQNAVKLTVYLANLEQFALLNEQMALVLQEPYPARAAVEVSKLPKGALVEIDAVVAL